MSRSFDLGPVSAYALAVKHGYTGTEAEWVAEMEAKRLEAVNAADSASASASASAESASESAESAASASESATNASNRAHAASASAIEAESYTHGGTGAREGEDTDNAKYYMEKAKEVAKVDIATTEKAGIVKPDGETITIDEDGTLRGANAYELPAATTRTIGGVKPDGDTITVDEDGTLHGQSKVDQMTGATADADGKAGMVPAPKAGQQDMVLHGDGTYRKSGGYIVYPEFTMDLSTGHLSATGGAGVDFRINSNGHLESEVL